MDWKLLFCLLVETGLTLDYIYRYHVLWVEYDSNQNLNEKKFVSFVNINKNCKQTKLLPILHFKNVNEFMRFICIPPLIGITLGSLFRLFT